MKITPLCMGDGRRRRNATSQVQFPKTLFPPRLPPLPWRVQREAHPQAPLGRPGPLLPCQHPRCRPWPAGPPVAQGAMSVSGLDIFPFTSQMLLSSSPKCGTSLHWRGRGMRGHGGGGGDSGSREALAWGAKFRSGDTKNLSNQQKYFLLR